MRRFLVVLVLLFLVVALVASAHTRGSKGHQSGGVIGSVRGSLGSLLGPRPTVPRSTLVAVPRSTIPALPSKFGVALVVAGLSSCDSRCDNLAVGAAIDAVYRVPTARVPVLPFPAWVQSVDGGGWVYVPANGSYRGPASTEFFLVRAG